MKPTLAAAQKRFETLLTDRCVIAEDETGLDNATLNTTTLLYEDGEDDETVSNTLPCLVRDRSDRQRLLGEQAIDVPAFDVLLRASDPTPALGATVRITVSDGNPELVGRAFTVRSTQVTSLNFAQVVRVQEALASERMP